MGIVWGRRRVGRTYLLEALVEQMVVALDEFPYLLEHSPELDSLVQRDLLRAARGRSDLELVDLDRLYHGH